MEWAAPDPSVPSPVAIDGGRDRLGSAVPPRPGIPRLGPMTVADVLDGSFAILKAAPATILAFTAVFAVPVQLFGAWLQRDLLGGESLLSSFDQSDPSVGSVDQVDTGGLWSQVVLLFGPSLALVFVAAALVRLVGAWHVGRDVSLAALLRGSLPLAAPLLVSWLFVHLLEGVGALLCGFPGLAVMTWFLVTAPVVGAERIGPVRAMRRSARLVARRFWPVMGLTLLSSVVAMLFGYAIGLVPTTLALLLGTDGYGWLVVAAAGTLTSLVTMPIVAGITVLIYLDLRVRTEGLDLELDLDEVFPG